LVFAVWDFDVIVTELTVGFVVLKNSKIDSVFLSIDHSTIPILHPIYKFTFLNFLNLQQRNILTIGVTINSLILDDPSTSRDTFFDVIESYLFWRLLAFSSFWSILLDEAFFIIALFFHDLFSFIDRLGSM
jgi:hypothetical protein